MSKEMLPRRDDDKPLEVSIWSGTSTQLCSLLNLPQHLAARLAAAAGTRRVLRVDVHNPRVAVAPAIRRLVSGEKHE